MTRDEQLTFCKVCKNQGFDPRIGIICSITDRVADFNESCKNYEEDFSLVLKNDKALNSKVQSINTANVGQRFLNYLIDSIFSFLFIMIYTFFLGIILAIIAPTFVQSIDENNMLFVYTVAISGVLIYYILFEFTLGRTPAKYFTGTRVVDEDGNVPSFSKILLRTICRLIPFEAFSFLGDNAIGWHDTLSKTRVVNIK